MMYDIKVPLEENLKGTAQQKGETIRGGRIHHYEKASVKATRELLTWGIKSNCKEQIVPFVGPVSLGVTFVFTNKTRKSWGQPKDAKPDCDNLVKLLQDVLADLGFFEIGDQQVSHLEVRKRWGETPCVYIHIAEDKVWRTWA